MGAELIQSSAAPLNFAAISEILQTEAIAIFRCSLIVVGLILFIEKVVLKPHVCTVLYYQVRELFEEKGKIVTKAQAAVPYLLRLFCDVLDTAFTISSGVVNAALVRFPALTCVRNWLTWKRSLILIQVTIGLVGFALVTTLFWLSMDMSDTWEEPTEVMPRDGDPCSSVDLEVEVTPPAVKLLAGAFIFVGGALQNCKAFMRIPLL